ncbi:hypothetical protein GCM10010112_13890 [Actinoplanes lobatus]|uniref:Uncharacterized protein n=1 Tax=Actinoplanes lobatus TaxID=113568 RepID=A0A7W7HMI4_9ACTN|nr:hypothetical protein [Actinoplanes lobatus]GGN59200.1 hypothetical protein GCM10010112_13890 [Actinoplanes lobatus]GIE42914.1 hypothetical protein Alo02nite_58120 [Actinoplanes lobatus]
MGRDLLGFFSWLQGHEIWFIAITACTLLPACLHRLERLCIFVLAFWSRKPGTRHFARKVYKVMLRADRHGRHETLANSSVAEAKKSGNPTSKRS